MPSISKIRFTNVVYDNGNKRYIDTTFRFDGFNGILLLENGAGKTVFVQTLIQAVLPRRTVAQRKIQETLQLSNSVAHIAVEWILEEQPRRYVLTAVSLFMNSKDQLGSQEFAMEYSGDSSIRIDTLPFVHTEKGETRPATREEMASYFRGVAEHSMTARFFSENDTLMAYGAYLEEHFKIIPAEWNKIAAINESEGGVEAYFENCRTTNELIDRLLIPTVEEGCAPSDDSRKGNGFAELFESQRDHFKQQMRLKRRIAEMQRVMTELDAYTKVQKDKYEAEQTMEQINGQLKAWQGRIRDRLAYEQEQLASLEQQAIELQQDLALNGQKQAACDVAVAREGYEQSHKAYEKARSVWQDAKERHLAALTESHNLTLARQKKECRQAQQLIAARRQALAELAAAPDVQELKKKMDENSAFLHGWFGKEEKRQQDIIDSTTDRQTELQKEQDRQEQKLSDQQTQRQSLLRQISAGEGQIQILLQQQEKIEAALFPDSLHQDPLQQQKEWQRQARHTEEEIKGYEKNIAFYTDEEQKGQRNLADDKTKLPVLQQERHQCDLNLARIESVAAGLIKKLQQWPLCAGVASDTTALYQRSSYLSQQLDDEMIMLQQQWQTLDVQRREAHRWLDIYEGQDSFTADPALVGKIEEWSSDFIYLKTGAELFRTYSGSSAEERKELYDRYPFWAASVVTTADELPRLMTLLQKAASSFFQPVFVLTEVEVRQLVGGQVLNLPQRQIVPAYWQNLLPDQFSGWMDAMRQQADATDVKLQENEQALEHLRPLQRELQVFYDQQPFPVYRDQVNRRRNLASQEKDLQDHIEEIERFIGQCRANIDKFRQNYHDAQEKQKQLQQWLEETEEYFALQRQHRELIGQNEELMRRVDELNGVLEESRKQLVAMKQQRESMLLEKASALAVQEQLKQKLYWQDVQNIAAADSDFTYDTLAERRRQLQNQLDGIHASRGRLESELAAAGRDERRLQTEMKRLRRSVSTVLQEDFPYPENGSAREEELAGRIPALKKEAEGQEVLRDKARTSYDTAKGRLENEEKRYFSQYQELFAFHESLTEVRNKLRDEQRVLQERSGQCRNRINDAVKEQKALQDIQVILDRKNEVYHFAADTVEPAVLSASERQDSGFFQQSIAICLNEAEADFKEVREKQDICEEKRNDFIHYCEHNVQEERLRRAIVDGLRSKDSYVAYAFWQEKSMHNLQAAVSLFEEERKGHYEHMEHMISHMVLYIQDICTGLKELADTTRIKVGDTTKNIYQISLPDWDEAMARTAVRTYLNELTTHLETEAYRDDMGREDGQKIHEALKKLLRTQQIMNCIFGNQAIRVRCRKATSGNDFSDRAHTWEDSNKWSGGEMWSKNMALFLGCLSYLSEKRCHVRRAKYNTRVVVADNPFGKASSDHVLDPVFFIARQLGFQIIALTAHQDGNFIRKYFPVVYSCRFADMENTKGRVLVPEKEIKTAFFEEEHPSSLARLDEYEEVGLF